MSAPAPTKLSFRDVWLSFPGSRGRASVPVLEGVGFDVAAGEFVCLVGPSGCGKSTLLNAAGGFARPDRGEVRVDGELVREPDPRRIFIFQEGAAFPWMTVAENVGFGLSRLPAPERARVTQEYVELVGLHGFERAYPRELSGGMRQRVEIARALAAGPDVLYMDEPFGALDYLTRFQLRAELLRLWQLRRQTILFVTHDVEEAVQLADRVVVLSKRPARVLEEVRVDLPRPRPPGSPESLAVRDRILERIGFVDLFRPAATRDGGSAAATDPPSTPPTARPGTAHPQEA